MINKSKNHINKQFRLSPKLYEQAPRKIHLLMDNFLQRQHNQSQALALSISLATLSNLNHHRIISKETGITPNLLIMAIDPLDYDKEEAIHIMVNFNENLKIKTNMLSFNHEEDYNDNIKINLRNAKQNILHWSDHFQSNINIWNKNIKSPYIQFFSRVSYYPTTYLGSTGYVSVLLKAKRPKIKFISKWLSIFTDFRYGLRRNVVSDQPSNEIMELINDIWKLPAIYDSPKSKKLKRISFENDKVFAIYKELEEYCNDCAKKLKYKTGSALIESIIKYIPINTIKIALNSYEGDYLSEKILIWSFNVADSSALTLIANTIPGAYHYIPQHKLYTY